jgi:hypothetical protein
MKTTLEEKKRFTCVLHNSDLYEYDTRRKDDLHVQKCITLMCRNGIINMGINLYNKLPLELRKVKGGREFQH